MTATMNRHRSIAVLLCAAALASCSYDKNAVQDIAGPVPAAAIRFFNFGVNAPGVNFYAGDQKVTAISTAGCSTAPSEACNTTGVESTTGVTYGGVGNAGLYSGLDAGQHTLSGRIAATTDKGLAISSLAATLEDGKTYSFYQSGLYNTTTKTIDAFVVEDPIPAEIDWSVATVRFVHAIYNANPMTLTITNVDSTAATFVIGGAVAYKGAGAFTTVPNGVYNLATRYSGSSTVVMARPNVSFVAGRTYTITARGTITTAPTNTGCAVTNVTCLDNTTNR